MLVREYFASTLPAWEAVYQRRTLYATIYQQRLSVALETIDELRLAPGSAALDIGCGPGMGTAGLLRRGFRVHAVDASPAMIARTLARVRSEGVPATVRGGVCDIHALPFRDAAFDLVLVVGVSEWLASLDEPLAEVARVLKMGGWLVLTADNSWALSCLLDPIQHPLVVPFKRAIGRILGRVWRSRRPLRTHARSARALERGLRRAGLVRWRSATLGFGPFTLFGRSLLPDGLGHALDRRLAALGRLPASPLRAAGLVHVVVAAK
jgi:SAM-dependent methyltransferase